MPGLFNEDNVHAKMLVKRLKIVQILQNDNFLTKVRISIDNRFMQCYNPFRQREL